METPLESVQHRFGILLVTLALLLGGTGLLEYTGRYLPPGVFVGLTVLLFALVLIVAVLSVPTRTHRTTRAIRLLVAATIGGQILSSVVESEGLRVIAQVCGLLCVGYTIIIVLRFLLRARQANADTIYAALCVFLLMGVFWAMLYSWIGRIEPGAFSANTGVPPGMGRGVGSVTSLYYSFVTLTTLGFGDITPVTAAARIVTVMEALTGQVFLVVLVARLVGLNVAQAAPSETPQK